MRKKIWITTQFIGFHRWENAPPEVAFLSAPHRHIFKVKCEFSVSHSDRQLEFFLVQQAVNGIIYRDIIPGLVKNPGQSCEMLAELLMTALRQTYACLSVEVSEDGENGAVVELLHPESLGLTPRKPRKSKKARKAGKTTVAPLP